MAEISDLLTELEMSTTTLNTTLSIDKANDSKNIEDQI